MRVPLRLTAVLVISIGLIGVVLALTVLNTDEESKNPGPATFETGATSATGATDQVATGPTAVPEVVVPVEIEGPLLGVNLTAYTRDGYGQPSVRKAMRTLAQLGSTAVTLVPTWYMQGANANRIAPDRYKTPSDQSLAKAVRWAREAGLQVVLKPHVDVIDDTYRGEIRPNNTDEWFRSYGQFIDHFATFATSHSATMFVVGTELKTLSTETDRWAAVIQMVRDRFFGPLTYAANWDEVEQVQFWDELDAIGVDAYYPLSQEGEQPTLGSLVTAWRKATRGLRDMAYRLDRPALLTEVGFPSQVGATVKPFEVTDQPADQEIQALAYRATFKALEGSDWLAGISWWSWRADLSPSEDLEREYTPEGKKAQGILSREQWDYEQ